MRRYRASWPGSTACPARSERWVSRNGTLAKDSAHPACRRTARAHSSVEEHSPYKRRVTGSNPVAPTVFSNSCLRKSGKSDILLTLNAWTKNCAANGCRESRPRCVRKPGHAPPCMTAANMASRRVYRRAHPHLESPESRKKSKRKYRISCYGLTQDDFNLLLKIQGYACGMCRELFAEGQLIHVDHDHGCCPVKNRSCGKCVRGLLCHGCNIALGHIEHRYAMARAYLDGPRPWAALRA